jgi:N-acetylglucosamine-6-phosphate deacetylase
MLCNLIDLPFKRSRSSGHLIVPYPLQQSSKHRPTKKSNNMLVKFTNCRLAVNGRLVEKDLWIDSTKGVIIDSQKCFYDDLAIPDRIINLGGKIIAPGYIDIQINGAMGMDFSVFSSDETYSSGVKLVNKTLVKYGVTAYCPTLTSQHPEVYKRVYPYMSILTLDTSSSSTSTNSKSAGRI